MEIKVSAKCSKILFWSSIGCFVLNYFCWNILNATTYLSASLAQELIGKVLGTAFCLSFVAGLVFFPMGVCLCKRTWRLPIKFFALTGMSFIIAFFMTAVFPEKEVLGGPEWDNSLLGRFLWNLSTSLFLQMMVQSPILAVTHFFTFEKSATVATQKRWRNVLFDFLALAIWLFCLCLSAYYLDRHCDC